MNKDAELFIAELADDIASAACNHCRGKVDVFDATHVIRLFIKGRLNAMLVNGEIAFPKLYAEAAE